MGPYRSKGIHGSECDHLFLRSAIAQENNLQVSTGYQNAAWVWFLFLIPLILLSPVLSAGLKDDKRSNEYRQAFRNSKLTYRLAPSILTDADVQNQRWRKGMLYVFSVRFAIFVKDNDCLCSKVLLCDQTIRFTVPWV